jgi:hypothetical protein
MKLKIAFVIGMTITLAPAPSRTAVAAGSPAPTATQMAQAAMACPAGTHWEADGYVRGGRWRAAHRAHNQAPNY